MIERIKNFIIDLLLKIQDGLCHDWPDDEKGDDSENYEYIRVEGTVR